MEIKESSKYFCFGCKKDISEKAAKACFQNKPKFGGRAYCFECQKTYVTSDPPFTSSPDRF